MSELQDNCAQDVCPEQSSSSSSSLPTAEECANQLSSIFNPSSIANPALEEIAERMSRQCSRLSKCCQNALTKDLGSPTNEDNVQMAIGSGKESFQIKISINKCQEVCQLLASANANTPSGTSPNIRKAWLSYRCFGDIVQSEIFTIAGTTNSVGDFTPMMNTFHVRSSLPELIYHFNEKKNATLRIYICTEGEVLGISSVDLRQLVAPEHDMNSNFEGRMIHADCYVKPRNKIEQKCDKPPKSSPHLSISLCIDRDAAGGDTISSPAPTQIEKLVRKENHRECTALVSTSTSSQTIQTASVDVALSPIIRNSTNGEGSQGGDDQIPKHLNEKAKQIIARETKLSEKEKEIYQAASSLEKKRLEWEQWRHQQELEWHENLRKKEAAMIRAVEERVCIMEKERLSSTESSKNNYEKLEARLRKALIEVEAKERQLKEIELGHQNEQRRKLAELELRERLVKEELKHSVEIERAKVNAAVDVATTATKKVKQLESEMDLLREQHRKTPEITLMHQLAELKGQLADSERRNEAMKAEKNHIIAEKEQFRSSVHKLAKALRLEREKAVKNRQRSNQQVQLSYDAEENSFVLGGGQDEIQRILTDLSKVSQIKTPTTNHSGYNKQHFSSGNDALQNNSMSPLPSPQPSRPLINGSHSTKLHLTHSADAVDYDVMATPG